MKRIASIQDISCLGRCSLTVALPVISAMGVECAILPTAVLSTHTSFPDFRCTDLTDQLLPITRHWKPRLVERVQRLGDLLCTPLHIGPGVAVDVALDAARDDLGIALMARGEVDHRRNQQGAVLHLTQHWRSS